VLRILREPGRPTLTKALAALDAWRAQYVKIARVALRGKPQLLEKIGVPARTSGTAAQRGEGEEGARLDFNQKGWQPPPGSDCHSDETGN